MDFFIQKAEKGHMYTGTLKSQEKKLHFEYLLEARANLEKQVEMKAVLTEEAKAGLITKCFGKVTMALEEAGERAMLDTDREWTLE